MGFEDAPSVIVKGPSVRRHSALETAWRRRLEAQSANGVDSTQGTATVREELGRFFKLPLTQVRVIAEFMGGGWSGQPQRLGALSRSTARRCS